MIHIEDKLVLVQWMLSQFGLSEPKKLFKELSGNDLVGFEEDGSTKYCNKIIELAAEPNVVVPDDLLYSYDNNIVTSWEHITHKRMLPGVARPAPLYFQYLALLFTEHYLHKYFSDPSDLCDDLNRMVNQINRDNNPNEHYNQYTPDDLNKLAFWIATGGGKTLMMHANILQFRRYYSLFGNDQEFNRTILLTPNESLSRQHLKEFERSGIAARQFTKEGNITIAENTIDIIDIHKLREQEGDKTISPEYFESNNLVLVDEGHRGSSGIDWIAKRNQICSKGFSFEYSATFGQAIRSSSGTLSNPLSKKSKLTQLYGRCIVFDYSYRYFHGDGYGKDYHILNLNSTWSREQTFQYLTGCILAYYQQKCVYRNLNIHKANYHFEDPLLILVGGKVTAQNIAHHETISDIQALINFINKFQKNSNGETVNSINQILSGRDDLFDKDSQPIFGRRLEYLQEVMNNTSPSKIFDEIVRVVFNSSTNGSLIIQKLKRAPGEIGLKISGGKWFGIINVGDADKLISLCEDHLTKGASFGNDEYSNSLFDGINLQNSQINILIGAKKFSEGWNSWRVSTMGLMNIGRSEGSEIIQLFGRGVRLKGYGYSLKRSAHVDKIAHPKHIEVLETINVFGVRSNYMKEFEEYMVDEGVSNQLQSIIDLPVKTREFQDKLRIIKVTQNAPDFFDSQFPILQYHPAVARHQVVLNWYPKIHSMSSQDYLLREQVNLNEGKLYSRHLAFIDYDNIYINLLVHKADKGWNNLQISKKKVIELLNEKSWYQLFIPAEELSFNMFDRVDTWQKIATSLAKKYMKRFYTHKHSEHELPYLAYDPIIDSDTNFFGKYTARISTGEQQIVNQVNKLKNILENEHEFGSLKFSRFYAIDFPQHLYSPLIQSQNSDELRISPVPLNQGEFEFICDLKKIYDSKPDILSGTELYILRNQSRGKGVGFFEAGNFYPDFILWALKDGKQHICFVDPKGLVHSQGFNDPKIQFHKTIKKIEQRLGDDSVVLDSFIISTTPRENVHWWQTESCSAEDFTRNHVLFQKDEKETYINTLLHTWLGSSNFPNLL